MRRRGGRGVWGSFRAGAVRPVWPTFSRAANTMFSPAGRAGLSAWAVQPQWYGSSRWEQEGYGGWRGSGRGQGKRVEASGTDPGSQGRPGPGPAQAPEPGLQEALGTGKGAPGLRRRAGAGWGPREVLIWDLESGALGPVNLRAVLDPLSY